MANQNMIINIGGEVSGGIVQKYQGEGLGNREKAEVKKTKENETDIYDVGISYASEQQDYVMKVVKILEAEHKKVFFAPKKENAYKAKDMYQVFYKIYRHQCRYIACFISEEYREKEYTMHEFSTALLRNKNENYNCIIPVYFGRRGMKGLDEAISYLEADKMYPVEIADQIVEIIS